MRDQFHGRTLTCKISANWHCETIPLVASTPSPPGRRSHLSLWNTRNLDSQMEKKVRDNAEFTKCLAVSGRTITRSRNSWTSYGYRGFLLVGQEIFHDVRIVAQSRRRHPGQFHKRTHPCAQNRTPGCSNSDAECGTAPSWPRLGNRRSGAHGWNHAWRMDHFDVTRNSDNDCRQANRHGEPGFRLRPHPLKRR